MSAVIYKMPGAAGRETNKPEVPPPLATALHWGRESIAHMVQRAIVSADDSLFGMASNAATELDRRRLFELMKTLGKRSAGLIEVFHKALSGSLTSAAEDEFELRLQDDTEIEQEIVAGRVSARVENEAKQTLWDFGMRIPNIPERDGVRDSFEKLRPAGVCAAFRRMLEHGKFDDQTRTILFKVFERQFLGDGAAIYEGLSLRLEAAGIASTASARKHVDSRRRGEPSYQLSPGVRGILGGMGIGNRASQGERRLSDGGQQRVALMTQVLDEIARDWAPEESASLQTLIGPLVRIALSDPSFFSDAEHPARDVLGSLTRRNEPRGQILERAALLLAALQINEEAQADVEPLSPDLLRDFLQKQRSSEAQIHARVEQSRVMAHERIKAAGSGSDLPAGIGRFLVQIWLPLASALHLKFGAESAEMGRMSRMLSELFGESRWMPKLEDLELSNDLLDSVGSELRSMAVPEPLVTKAKTLLKEGLEDKAARSQLLDLETLNPRPMTAPAESESAATVRLDSGAGATLADAGLWRAAIPVGAWFRLFDRKTQQTRWLSAGVLYPGTESLSFNGFDSSTNLGIQRRLFLQDIHEGKAEAVEATENQSSALRLLVAAWQSMTKDDKAKGIQKGDQDPAQAVDERRQDG